MRKFLVDERDGTRWELPPLSYDEFTAVGLWSSASDMAYDSWLRLNGFKDPENLNDETLSHCVLVLVAGDYAELKFEHDGVIFSYSEQAMKDSIALQAKDNETQRMLADCIGPQHRCRMVRTYKEE